MPKRVNRFKSIKFKLLIFSIVMSLFPLLILGGYNLFQGKSYLWEAVKYHHSYETSRVVGELNFLLKEAERTLKVLAKANGEALMSRNTKEQERLLYSCMTNLPYAEGMKVIDSNGNRIAGVSRLNLNGGQTSYSEPVSLINTVDKFETYISQVYLDQYGQSSFQLAVPIIVDGSKVEGALVVDISLRTIVDLLSKVSGNYGTYVFLVDESGQLIGHEDFSQVLRSLDVRASLPSISYLEEQSSQERPLVRIYNSYTGKEVVGAYAKLAGTNWAVVYEQPVSGAFSSYFNLRNTFILSMLILITLVLMISLYFGIGFVRQLDVLKEGVRRINLGEAGFVLPIDTKDEIGNVLLDFNELSKELKKKRDLEVALREADKMVTVGLLAAGVAHEINNPLATICLSVEELKYEIENNDQIDAEYKEKLIQYLNIISTHAYKGSKITQDLLNFSRQNKSETKTWEVYNLNDAVKKATELAHYIIKKNNIEVKFDLDLITPIIWGDEVGMQQIIFNLICNSADAMSDGGILTFRTSVENKNINLEVEDTGKGIPEEDLQRVFEPFFTTKPCGKGTGLGLAVCYGMVKQAEGNISIESKLGQGTTVSISLPIQKGGHTDEDTNC